MGLFGIAVLSLTAAFGAWELIFGLFNMIWGKYDMNANAQRRGRNSFVNGVVLAALVFVEHLIFL